MYGADGRRVRYDDEGDYDRVDEEEMDMILAGDEWDDEKKIELEKEEDEDEDEDEEGLMSALRPVSPRTSSGYDDENGGGCEGEGKGFRRMALSTDTPPPSSTSACRRWWTASMQLWLIVAVVVGPAVLLAAAAGFVGGGGSSGGVGAVGDAERPPDGGGGAIESPPDANDSGAGGGADEPSSSSSIAVPDPLPPLSSLLVNPSDPDDGGIIPGADVSWLLDFAIVGYAKCGTTFLMNYLRKRSKETWVNKGEVHDIARGHPARVVSLFYPPHTNGTYTPSISGARLPVRFGLKDPEDLETPESIPTYHKYFPRTKFVVSMRHPVRFFESFYNFRAYHHYPKLMPTNTSMLIGPCFVGTSYPSVHAGNHNPSHPNGVDNMGVCTDRANFHWSLSRLGKTPMDTDDEKELLDHDMSVERTTNQIFLMEDRQILLSNPASANFTSDLGDFLGLTADLPDLEPYNPPPGNKYADPTRYDNLEAAANTIDICDTEHDEVRKVLVRNGREAARWIVGYFMESPDVTVSSRKLFIRLLEDWGRDPCEDNYGG